MSILVVGLSHQSAPVTLLERTAVTGDVLLKLMHDVHGAASVSESMVVSTCNRVEIYADVDKFHSGVSAITELIAQYGEVSLEELSASLYVHYEDRAVQHVFGVACGLDSMVVGESQIVAQLRSALRLGQEQKTVGRVLNDLLQQALRVGKRARAETGIDRAGASLVTVGLEETGPLAGRRALVVGAGSMSALAVATLARSGIGEVLVANRTPARARRLAESAGVPARAVEWAGLSAALAEADIVISCTGASEMVITADMIPDHRFGGAEQPDRELFILDLALPHDVEPAARRLPGVRLFTLDDLGSAGGVAAGRRADIGAVRRIVCAEVTAFQTSLSATAVAPTVTALRSRAAEVVEAELTRLRGRLPELDDKSRSEVAQTVRRVVDKLLHAPTVRVKELAASPGGDGYATALRELFDLDPTAPEAVIRAEDVQ
jgi:glutamyl-tRNA reductase